MIKAAVEEGSQFLIATHSPVMMAFPGAQLWNFNLSPPTRVAWEEVEHVSLLRAFLSDPEAFTRRL
jgi:predicted ATPase